MRQFEHVDVADGDGLRERIAGHTVEESDLASDWKAGFFDQVADFGFARAIENWRGERNAVAETIGEIGEFFVVEAGNRAPDRGFAENFLEPLANGFGLSFAIEQTAQSAAEFFRGPAKMRLENLADVHTRRNAERIEDDFDGSAIGQVGHVFIGNDASDDALVAVAACHFVADGELALHGDVALDELDYARRKFVALLEFVFALLGDFAEDVDLARGHLLDFIDFFDEERILVVETKPLEVSSGDFLDDVAIEFGALGEQALVGFFVVQVGLQLLAAEQRREALQALVGEDADFIGEVLFELEHLCGFDGVVAFVFFRALAAENLHVDDGAFDARRAIEGRVANVSGFFAEDRAQQVFLPASAWFHPLALPCRPECLPGRTVAPMRMTPLSSRLRRNVSLMLGISRVISSGPSFVSRASISIFLDVNRSVVIVFHQLFADQDGVFKVVAAPRNERDEHVSAESQFAAIGARTIGKNLACLHTVTYANERLLIDASVLVGALKFCELIDVGANFAAQIRRSDRIRRER